MISLFGEISLIFALVFAGLQSILPLVGVYRHNIYAKSFGYVSALGQFISLMAAYVLLTIAFIISDFSLSYVAANSHPSLPFLYRATALWGAHEGSILLWVVILNAWTIFFAITQKHHPLRDLTLSFLGIISFCFMSFLVFTSNPFLLADTLQTGRDLNPLLQDPGFVIHPPMLYVGYVGFSVAFAITQAALLQNKLDQSWARVTRQFATLAWCFLTFGILLGSWWAYRVLGWGGFWFWDPVENASLLPWITGIALIHILVLVEKRQIGIPFAVLLSIICFSLSLLGTFLVRSGVLISVHTFANDPARGSFLLLLLVLIVTASLILYMIRLPIMRSVKPALLLSLRSRELFLFLNGGLLLLAMLTILLGTLYPLILDALHLNPISVGAPYFNSVMMPLVCILLIAMGVGVLCGWQDHPLQTRWQNTCKFMAISVIGAIMIAFFLMPSFDFLTIVILSLCLWVIITALSVFYSLRAMALAHTGFAILIIGLLLSSTLSEEIEVRLRPGNAVHLGPYQFFFLETKDIQGENYRGIRADIEVLRQAKTITHLYPEKRIYNVREMVMTKVAIHPSLFRDLYIALGESFEDDSWSLRLYYKPFIRWIGLGGLLMIIGGFFSFFNRKITS